VCISPAPTLNFLQLDELDADKGTLQLTPLHLTWNRSWQLGWTQSWGWTFKASSS
jgi:hypothetical protein